MAGESRWLFGPFGWHLVDVVTFEPVPCKGAQGLWPVPAEILPVLRARHGAALAHRGALRDRPARHVRPAASRRRAPPSRYQLAGKARLDAVFAEASAENDRRMRDWREC